MRLALNATFGSACVVRCTTLTAALLLVACSGDDARTTTGTGTAGSALEDGGVDATEAGIGTDASAPEEPAFPPTPTGPEQRGQATYFAPGAGACGIDPPADKLVAAISNAQYSRTNCGRCAEVSGPKGTVIVRIADRCPGCGRGDLDLATAAFVRIAEKSAGRVAIKWRFVECP